MFRLRREHLLENRRGFQLSGEIFVGRNDGDRFIEREGIEDRSFRVLRITNVNLFHRLFVGQDPCLVVELLPIFVIIPNRSHIVPFSFCLRADRPGLFHGFPAIL
jgi:hypothetical protein